MTTRRITLMFGLVFLFTNLCLTCGAESIEVISDIAYKKVGSTGYEKERCKLDLYLPQGRDNLATVLWFHGGSLEKGDKSGDVAVGVGRRFAAEGIAVAVVNYRLSPKIGYPAYVDDTAASFAWVYKNIKAHGGDPDSVFISGHSAGGYLAAMAALDPRYLKEYRLGLDAVAGAIPVSGQMITHATVRKERRIPATRPIIDEAAPGYHVRKDAPPFLNISGSNDLPARAAENLYFVDAMKAAGHGEVEYLEVEGRTHSTIANKIPQADDLVAKAIGAFIQKHRR